jgi:DNA primase
LGSLARRGAARYYLRIGYLVESPFTVMAFAQKGFPAVSPFGWSLSPQQIDILAQIARGWIFLPDANKRKEAAQFAGLLAERCWVKMPEFGLEDPESLSLEQIKALA